MRGNTKGRKGSEYTQRWCVSSEILLPTHWTFYLVIYNSPSVLPKVNSLDTFTVHCFTLRRWELIQHQSRKCWKEWNEVELSKRDKLWNRKDHSRLHLPLQRTWSSKQLLWMSEERIFEEREAWLCAVVVHQKQQHVLPLERYREQRASPLV